MAISLGAPGAAELTALDVADMAAVPAARLHGHREGWRQATAESDPFRNNVGKHHEFFGKPLNILGEVTGAATEFRWRRRSSARDGCRHYAGKCGCIPCAACG